MKRLPGALILDGHSRAAVEATQSLGRAGVEVCVSAGEADALAFSSRYAKHRLRQPPCIPVAGFIEWLQEVDARHRFQLIIPSTESSLLAFVALPDDSSLRRRAILPDNDALLTALDRGRTWRLASELGVPVPATRLVDRLPTDTSQGSYPLVLKPARSKSVHQGELRTYAPIIVRDDAERRSVLEQWVPRMQVLEQEYVQGWGVGIELLYDAGRLVRHFAHERLHEWPLTGGASTYRRAIEPPEAMLDASLRLLEALSWNGVAMVEFKRRADGSFALMEINPRLWGSLALSTDAGVDFPLSLWKVAAGEALPPQRPYRRGMRTRLLSGDLVWQKANLVADRRNPLLLTRPRLLSLLEPLLVLSGRERWDHFSWADPGPMAHEFKQIVRIAARAGRRRRLIRSFLLRRTAIMERVVRRVAKTRVSRSPSIVFLCQGNICRSPFAAIVARDRLEGFNIDSAGFDQRANRATPVNVVEAAARMGYDMSQCRSTAVTEGLLQTADVVCLMDLDQYDQLAKAYPYCLERTVPLGMFASPPVAEIEDPDRADDATTRRVLSQITSAVEGLAARFGAARMSVREGGGSWAQ
ncbi:MAG: arsenate reductase/protein-tyrosine-phosphatase family protein [Steroidobacteraceae bacterium]